MSGNAFHTYNANTPGKVGKNSSLHFHCAVIDSPAGQANQFIILLFNFLLLGVRFYANQALFGDL